jgi:hypothetical protein
VLKIWVHQEELLIADCGLFISQSAIRNRRSAFSSPPAERGRLSFDSPDLALAQDTIRLGRRNETGPAMSEPAAKNGRVEWWAHQDSNLGQAGYEPAALTAELWARTSLKVKGKRQK